MKGLRTLGALAAAAALAVSAGAASAKDYRLGLITPPPHQWTKTAQAMADQLKKETDGAVNILIFPSGQLGNEAQMLQQLQTGALDFAFLTLGEFSNRDPNYGIFLAPYIVDDVAGARKLLQGETANKLLDQVDQFGLVGLGYGMAGMRQIVMANEVDSVDDISGKKIRTIPFAPELDFWKKVGAAPTPMPLPALYDAFANGQVDGMQIDFEGTWNSKYYEHADTIIESNHMMFPMIAVASGRSWQQIPEGDREKVEAAFDSFLDELIGSYASIDADYLAQLKTTDVPVITVGRPFFGDAIDEWYVTWREEAPMLTDLEAEAEKIRN
ncbi:TRAP transporter substrate-binding protein [Amorphus orientalis]|uniref:TRAP-type C4-dicarboxylate transport system substrate-binding protein n=1 Tax=Amorphus orientalis TaxID=649198 RepID=A0AAE3VLZ9_9HYPH|nr:TRAP transporter substrate-binding protein [Amorphus orientalis]MDQ0314407.1 TRAP-type C4-dicarboxylate transport system substrate-binding protein [Amorphus orientalis]